MLELSYFSSMAPDNLTDEHVGRDTEGKAGRRLQWWTVGGKQIFLLAVGIFGFDSVLRRMSSSRSSEDGFMGSSDCYRTPKPQI